MIDLDPGAWNPDHYNSFNGVFFYTFYNYTVYNDTPSGLTIKVTIVDLFYSNSIIRIPTWNIMVWFVGENNPFILRHPPLE